MRRVLVAFFVLAFLQPVLFAGASLKDFFSPLPPPEKVQGEDEGEAVGEAQGYSWKR